MKRSTVVVILAIFLVMSILVGLSCAPQTELEISITQLENGIMVKNVGSVDCLVCVHSPEGEQQFELAIGQNTTVTGMSQPVEVSAVSV